MGALPPPVNVPVPSVVEPSVKVTVPVGVPGPVPVTVAVKVTDWPTTDGLAEELTAVAVVCPEPDTVDPNVARFEPTPAL